MTTRFHTREFRCNGMLYELAYWTYETHDAMHGLFEAYEFWSYDKYDDTYRCSPLGYAAIVEFHDCGKVAMKQFVNLQGRIHSNDDMPAMTLFRKDGSIKRSSWYHNGKYHREHAPAVIYYDKYHKVTEERYYKHGHNITEELKESGYFDTDDTDVKEFIYSMIEV